MLTGDRAYGMQGMMLFSSPKALLNTSSCYFGQISSFDLLDSRSPVTACTEELQLRTQTAETDTDVTLDPPHPTPPHLKPRITYSAISFASET